MLFIIRQVSWWKNFLISFSLQSLHLPWGTLMKNISHKFFKSLLFQNLYSQDKNPIEPKMRNSLKPISTRSPKVFQKFILDQRKQKISQLVNPPFFFHFCHYCLIKILQRNRRTDNLKKHPKFTDTKFVPPEGSLWREIHPNKKNYLPIFHLLIKTLRKFSKDKGHISRFILVSQYECFFLLSIDLIWSY